MRCQTILIVEDDVNIRETLKSLLELEGFAVFAAVNGQDGLNALKHITAPCLVLLDLLMPVMDGTEFLKVKSSDSVIATIPVCVVSAVADRTQAPGAVGYIKKPIDFDALLRFVRRYCGG